MPEQSNMRTVAVRAETSLFSPSQALGLICSSVPPVFAPLPLDTENLDGLICCAVESQLCLYSTRNLGLFSAACEPIELEITAVAADCWRCYAAFGFSVAIIKNRKIERRLIVQNGGAKLMLSFTEILVVVDKGDVINVFDTETGALMVQLENPAFKITNLLHPHTYLNKILIASSDGRMRIWNLKSEKLVHEFEALDDDAAEISVLEQSSVVDIIGVGMANGKIQLMNIKFDRLICSFRQTGGRITALSFRTDGVETMASASSEGTIAIWDLEERALLGQLAHAHLGSITWLHFLLGQSFLLSAGEDNKIVKWFFRNEQSLPEVNVTMQGHSAPATTVKFSNEIHVASASQDGHVRQFNVLASTRCIDFGLAREVRRGDIGKDRYIEVEMEPIEKMELSAGRESVWDNAICSHADSPLVSTWSTRLKKRGAHLLYHERFSKDPSLISAFASAIFLSNCGNFALIGYSSGHVDVFNMQSGKYKFSLEAKETTEKLKSRKNKQNTGRAHASLVSGVALDMLNRNAVTGSSDGKIHFWKFGQPSLLCSVMRVKTGVRIFRLDLNNSLLAVGLESGEVGIVDVLCRRLARHFSHNSCTNWPEGSAHLTALEFSNDGNWLLSSDNQGFIKVWDLASGLLIDVVYHMHPCIAMAFSPRGDVLATCHVGQRGVYLWANKSLYASNMEIVAEEHNEQQNGRNEIAVASLPIVRAGHFLEGSELDSAEDSRMGGGECSSAQSSQEERVVTIDEDEMEDEEDEECAPSSSLITSASHSGASIPKQQLDPTLYTLSGLPSSRWAGLPIYELIRQRNRPIEPPKKTKSAPFFLPTTETAPGVVLFDFANESSSKKLNGEKERDEEKVDGGEERLRIAVAVRQQKDQTKLQTDWAETLMGAKIDSDFCELFESLKNMSLASIDFQIRALNGASELAKFLEMLIAVMETRRNFDLVQSYLAAFLNIHHEQFWGVEKKGRGGGRSGEQILPKQGEQQEAAAEEEEVNGGAVLGGVGCNGKQQLLHIKLKKLLALQKQMLRELQPLFNQNISLAEFIKSALI